MNALSVTPLCLLVAACSSTDVSRVPPFSSVSNRSVSIVRTAYLKPLNEGLFLGDGISFLRKPLYELTDHKPDSTHRVLRPGSRVRIDSIRDEVLIDGRTVVAYGLTSLSDGTEADFAYRWGFYIFPTTILERAPWESTFVPERREWEQGESGAGE
jgi:hypothetical protein